ncbi:major facilitator superfamily domain-containing protein [Polychytrium aggregatum]|uniref:major facilitator superfamily domain-containing protein n=1 Tax=Polychytrium aggregatum TaxID=110093 RepID=UPI0022FF4073|nr:major facilitator superfamily domain-containing protein [Polychytrium aggregatum]KAI9204751.1 major facilitator superfamily domain-containing protein [Polychytrium aggregatum]
MAPSPKAVSSGRTLFTIFASLLIDILAFTIILPLYPRILANYQQTDGHDETTLYYHFQSYIRQFRVLIGGTGTHLDIVLIGGALGSMFSFLQFVSSPWIGSLSDKYGRKTILLLSMIGNGLSMLLWIFSKSFSVFVLSRIIGGLTEGNVQMSIAMISDVTTPETRSRGLALVGIAFSLGFTIGPPLGAYFTSLDLAKIFPWIQALPINQYSTPALFAFVLIVIESAYMYLALPETLHFKAQDESGADSQPPESSSKAEPAPGTQDTSQLDVASTRKRLLTLGLVHFLFLFFFSGMEFTLTFLTHDRFHFSHANQGKLLGYMGILSALIQGGYVRRVTHKYISERTLVLQGIAACAVGLFLVASWATTVSRLYIGVTFLAFTSGTVVTSLTALAASFSGGSRGKILGEFRSMGQLGRSLGPIFACSVFWIIGSERCYWIGAAAMVLVVLLVVVAVPKQTLPSLKQKSQ